MSCLSLSCYISLVEVVKTLIEYGAKIDSDCVDCANFGMNGQVQVDILNVLQEHGWINIYYDDIKTIQMVLLKFLKKNNVYILSFGS